MAINGQTGYRRIGSFAACALILALSGAGTAGAEVDGESVTVEFGLSADVCCGQPIVSTKAACQLRLPPGANGFDVLDAAVSHGCIDSYDAAGSQLRCISGVCARTYVNRPGPYPFSVSAGSYWAAPNLHSFSAYDGAEFIANYVTYVCPAC